MNRARSTLLLFAVLAVAQLGVPVHLLVQRELVLRLGEPVRLRLAPFDPYDPFRGRYLALRYAEDRMLPAPGGRLDPGQPVYLNFAVAADGFVQVRSVTRLEPESALWVKTRLRSRDLLESEAPCQVEWPFDRFYLNERSADRAEQLLRERTRREEDPSAHPEPGDRASPDPREDYAVVRLRHGRAVVESIHLDGRPLEDWLGSVGPEAGPP